MKAVVFHGIGDIRLDEVPEPKLAQQTDAIVQLTASAICGTDLHMIRGTLPGMRPGTILGHEGVGLVEQLGGEVRNFDIGDRVVIASTIACGNCSYCRAGYFAQCDVANPNGPLAGTAFFGGPASSGPFDGLQAEKVRVPFAHVGLVKLPEKISDDQALLLSDIFPTGYMGAELAEVKPGNSVVVFGCGPVGQFAIASCKLLGAGRIFAVDCVDSRLKLARAQGAEVIDFSREDPVAVIRALTAGIGTDRAIDAVGCDALRPHQGPAEKKLSSLVSHFEEELREVAPEQHPAGDNWHPGDAPSLALQWCVEAVAKAGSVSIIGVYGDGSRVFPVGLAMNKNLTVKMGNCNHRKYIPHLIDLVIAGTIDPAAILTHKQPLSNAIHAYKEFDRRQPNWVKVELQPAA